MAIIQRTLMMAAEASAMVRVVRLVEDIDYRRGTDP